jgi:hypothetical protein
MVVIGDAGNGENELGEQRQFGLIGGAEELRIERSGLLAAWIAGLNCNGRSTVRTGLVTKEDGARHRMCEMDAAPEIESREAGEDYAGLDCEQQGRLATKLEGAVRTRWWQR